MSDRSAYLALDIITDQRKLSGPKALCPTGVGHYEDGYSVDERCTGIEAGLGKFVCGCVSAYRQQANQNVGFRIA
jgi:hypothetical protein